MKKIILCVMPLVLTACSAPTQHSTVPLDVQAVEQYKQEVVQQTTNIRPAKAQDSEWELNQSDKRPKVKVIQVQHPRVYPSMHYGYGWGNGGYRGHYSGIGLGMDGW